MNDTPKDNLICIMDKEDIEAIVAGIAHQISEDYKGREPILIGVLKGDSRQSRFRSSCQLRARQFEFRDCSHAKRNRTGCK